MAATARGERTRRAFRDGAKQVIAEKGFLRTTIGEIAAAAGRSPASFYNYYDSKEDLLEELADEFRHETEENRDTGEVMTGALLSDVMHDAVRPPTGTPTSTTWPSSWACSRRRCSTTGSPSAGGTSASSGSRRSARASSGPRPTATARASTRGSPPVRLGSMFEHFCYVSLAQGGAFSDRPFDDEDAIRTIASIWYHAVYWRPAESTPAPGG